MKYNKNKYTKNHFSGLRLFALKCTKSYTGVISTASLVVAGGVVSGYMLAAQAKVSETELADNSAAIAAVSTPSVAGETDAKKTTKKSSAKKVTSQTTQTEPAASPTVTTASTLGTMSGMRLYNDGVQQSLGRPAEIASQPTARWFGGWNTNVRAEASQLVDASSADGSIAVLVLYNIPQRDCGSYSAGGASSSTEYRAWIDELVGGVRKRQAMIILEPDALAGMDCLSQTDQTKRLADIAYAVNQFATQTLAPVYIDAGNDNWQSVDTMVDRLTRANVANAHGFALNVSNFARTDTSNTYGAEIATQLGGKSFVVDTSRNGNGPAPDDEWCNPPGRALGENPTTTTGVQYADAYLWLKVPGESDGECNGGPAAGEWWQAYADKLIRNSR